MPTSRASAWRRIGVFLVLTFLFSSVFYGLILTAGRLTAGRLLYVAGLMWCPGLAALATTLLFRRSVRDLPWGWGPSRYNRYAYLIPVVYALPVYLVIWSTGLGGFPNPAVETMVRREFGWPALPGGLVLAGYVVLVTTVGMVRSTAHALGEEIGWRGFLVPELVKVMRPGPASLVSGLIWAAWHYPILLFVDYNLGTPWWVALPCFTVMIVGCSYLLTWLSLRSGSLWPAVILHASHNTWIQSVLTPLTTDTGPTLYLIDEFGVGLAVSNVLAAVILWRYWPPRGGETPSA